jgi:hypothetical protein
LRHRLGPNPPLGYAGVFPELAGDLERVDTSRLPPCALVPDSMSRTVMGPAQRDHEFIAGLATERPRLHVSEMMGIRWLAAADQARLLDA